VTGLQFIKHDSPRARWPYLLAFCLTMLGYGLMLPPKSPTGPLMVDRVAAITGFALALIGAQRHVRGIGYHLQWRRPLRSLFALFLIVGNLTLFYLISSVVIGVIFYVLRVSVPIT